MMGRPGFSMLRKKVIELQTRHPAVVRLSDTSIAFTGGATNPEYAPVEASLLETLETELLKNEKSLMKKSTSVEADWTLALKVTGYSLPEPARRTQGSGNTSVNYTRWAGTLNAAYQVLDRSGKIHDAQNISASYDREFSSSGVNVLSSIPNPFNRHAAAPTSDSKTKPPKTTEDVKQILIGDVVGQIGANLGNTTRSINVLVATGDDNLNRASVFMGDKLWSRALDLLNSTPAFPSPDDESYRQYNLGLVYEALSYDSKDVMDQRQNIYKAAEYYDKALELNPRERYFVDSVARGKDAIARYKAIDDQLAVAKKARTNGSQMRAVSTSGSSGGAPNAANSSPANTNVFTAQDAIELYTNSVPEEQIIEMIRKSAVQFDPIDKSTVLSMAKAKLPISIQNELRRKVNAPQLTDKTSAPHHTPPHSNSSTSVQ
jgi:tetratricopeptide (TPR) repeat protein